MTHKIRKWHTIRNSDGCSRYQSFWR